MMKIKIAAGLTDMLLKKVIELKNRGKSMMDKLMDKSKDNLPAEDNMRKPTEDEQGDKQHK